MIKGLIFLWTKVSQEQKEHLSECPGFTTNESLLIQGN